MAKTAIFTTVLFTVLGSVTPNAYAAAFTSVQDKMTRLQKNTMSQHTFTIVLPGGVNWDSTGNNDILTVTFASSSNAFTPSASGTWTVTTTVQFSVTDNASTTALTMGAITSTDATGSQTYPNCSGDYVTQVNVTDRAFKFKRCSDVDAANASAVGITIKIASAFITNPATASNNQQVTVALDDEGVSNAYSDSLAVAILDSDQVGSSGGPAATSTLTFALNQDPMTSNTAADCSVTYATSQSSSATVGFNTLVVGSMNVATSTICTYVSSNAETAVKLYGYSANGGLFKAGPTYLAGSTYNTTALKAGAAFSLSTADNGYCVMSSGTNYGNNTTSTSPFGGGSAGCTYSSGELSGAGSLTTSLAEMWSMVTPNSSGATAYAHIIPKVIILSSTAAGTYSDTLYFIAVGTF